MSLTFAQGAALALSLLFLGWALAWRWLSDDGLNNRATVARARKLRIVKSTVNPPEK